MYSAVKTIRHYKWENIRANSQSNEQAKFKFCMTKKKYINRTMKELKLKR